MGFDIHFCSVFFFYFSLLFVCLFLPFIILRSTLNEFIELWGCSCSLPLVPVTPPSNALHSSFCFSFSFLKKKNNKFPPLPHITKKTQTHVCRKKKNPSASFLHDP
ncbi:hypothetical protein, unlikely [Trypanosoma brucei gambiense DAL972]|uniref:Uncharacterized protein n=1 Tax=Trypanosoma brucei gambiense (strain MHOM/CI/86/DAL972) TaxID=679716 RepID=D0A7W9_TRYB9|nr:hypothetical protein, unlikely [Trypanosoma brucei gambiense DAL972]CBH17770.1 hypothetical protein, unlikely [Trypanosoma brucei gambiense DAL972]|eukprot:XP_011780034.1 hypothetical protein, unlikely [Trypanosoma brucei gambiense DAL972]